jgi:hypothetical protein
LSWRLSDRLRLTVSWWGVLRSLQDCVCTHIERDLECSSEVGKKEGGNLIRGR